MAQAGSCKINIGILGNSGDQLGPTSPSAHALIMNEGVENFRSVEATEAINFANWEDKIPLSNRNLLGCRKANS